MHQTRAGKIFCNFRLCRIVVPGKWASRRRCKWGRGRARETGGGLVKWIDLNGRFSVNLESGFPKKKKKAGIQSAEGLAGLPRNPHCALQRLVIAVERRGRPGPLHKYSRGRPVEISERKRVSFPPLLNFNLVPLQTPEIELKFFLP